MKKLTVILFLFLTTAFIFFTYQVFYAIDNHMNWAITATFIALSITDASVFTFFYLKYLNSTTEIK